MTLDLKRREIWDVDGHLFMLGDLELGDLEYFISILPEKVEMVYTDPPWNKGLAKWFRNLAHKYDTSIEDREVNWDSFILRFYTNIAAINPKVLWLDMSISDTPKFVNLLKNSIKYIRTFEGIYNDRPYYLNLFSNVGDVDFTPNLNIKGTELTEWAYNQNISKDCLNVFDMFMGLGLTAKMALKYDKRCFGMELNPDRLNKTIDLVIKKTGALPKRYKV